MKGRDSKICGPIEDALAQTEINGTGVTTQPCLTFETVALLWNTSVQKQGLEAPLMYIYRNHVLHCQHNSQLKMEPHTMQITFQRASLETLPGEITYTNQILVVQDAHISSVTAGGSRPPLCHKPVPSQQLLSYYLYILIFSYTTPGSLKRQQVFLRTKKSSNQHLQSSPPGLQHPRLTVLSLQMV